MPHTVIIGGGQAGGRYAEALRKAEPDTRITLLTEEAHAPYERPPLSKAVLAGTANPDSTRLALDWAALGIEIRTGSRATAIDRAAKQVVLAHGALNYDRLVLATGARPRWLPALGGSGLPMSAMPISAMPVFALRDLADAAALRAAITPGKRVLLVGGGVIGLEVAATAASLGAQTIVVEMAPRLLGRCAPAFLADRLLALHRARGVEVRLGVGVVAAAPSGAGLVATLTDGSQVEADCAVLGIGALPNQELAEAAGLPVADGILVDARGRSLGCPDILAIGDVARHPLPRFGVTLRQESWRHAEAHARAAAAGIEYDEVPGFWSDQHGARLLVEGLPELGTELIRDAGDKPLAFYLHPDGRLVGAATLGDTRAMAVARRLIAAGARPDPAGLADPALDLRVLLKG